ncbi:hypothetical protein HaLaN_11952 [Haematococcus lacustris]|uniref:Uncharacterized protein n=1 Tax=Haematococcus lacustris TaxID=44745 RepID=A0A699Z233_HAELA|nr:hypothetical protein HaLaN_11952 [Haematococcus lacustris]
MQPIIAGCQSQGGALRQLGRRTPVQLAFVRSHAPAVVKRRSATSWHPDLCPRHLPGCWGTTKAHGRGSARSGSRGGAARSGSRGEGPE